MISDIYKNRSRSFIVFPMMLIGIIPAIAFYFGFWEFKFDYQLRMTFLSHDPNILSYNLLFAYIFTLYFFNFDNFKWITKYSSIFIISGFYGVPIFATLSRTALAAFCLIFVLYILFAESIKLYKFLAFFLAFIIVTTVVIKLANYDPVSAFTERVSEGDNTRTDFLAAAIKVVGNNFFTGVGLANFGDKQWRISNGFFMRLDGQIVQTSSHIGMLDILMIGGIFFLLAIIYLLLFPTLKIYKRRQSCGKNDFYLDRFLTISVFTTFIVINLTYSSYMSKTAWTSVTLLYVLTNKYLRVRQA